MRASICVLGPLLSRFKQAQVSLPGGCAIGMRPIDIHIENLRKMGAKIEVEKGYVDAFSEKLKGNTLNLSFPSVGATENLIMAAVFAEGKTVIKNAAREPEIDDFINFLNKMGAKIEGIDEGVITVEGVQELKSVTYTPIGDRIEAGTYIILGLLLGEDVEVSGFNPHHLDCVLKVLKEMGGNLVVKENSVVVSASKLKNINIATEPYPGFPTDLQAQIMTLCLFAQGESTIVENIFENRFMHVSELQRLGANIKIQGNKATIQGGANLKGVCVMCTDLRASAALVLAALNSEGETEVLRIYHLKRGYEDLVGKIKKLGAQIELVKTEPYSDL